MMSPQSVDSSVLSRFPDAVSREWLETNGLGGWASSSLCFTNTRRYHGLLVLDLPPPRGRMVLVSRLEESIKVKGRITELASNQYPNAVHPNGYEFLEEFRRDLIPEWTYTAEGLSIRKRLFMPYRKQATILEYSLLRGDSVEVSFKPFFVYRDYHSLAHANSFIRTQAEFRDGKLKVSPYDSLPACHVSIPGSTFVHKPEWYYQTRYAAEAERGLDCEEDVFTYGCLSSMLFKGSPLHVVISVDDPSDWSAQAILEAELQRRQNLFSGFEPDSLDATLRLAADQFIVSRADSRRTVIAGYHWFTDWGRDTMIALPGLCLATNRSADAKGILQTFADCVRDGMIPNRFPDLGQEPEYNTIDASLWFVIAGYQYFKHTNDAAFLSTTLFPKFLEILQHHEQGTRYSIKEDTDALLNGGEPGVQLTWMDAKVGDWVVTPRTGKPVEINALWYNVLEIMAEMARVLKNAEQAERFRTKAIKTKAAFQSKFWNPALECLYDVLDANSQHAEIRPNQIFALSLPFPLLELEQAEKVLRTIERYLLTPRGLRSLAAGEKGYRGVYEGGPWERDGAYHQGTVWSWLIGPYVHALVRVRGERGLEEARAILSTFSEHLFEAGIGTVSEIFDANPPFRPRGCIAQAWGVAELLRAHTLVNRKIQ